MAAPIPEAPVATITLTGALYSWPVDWESFRRSNPGSPDMAVSGDTAYCLPEAAVGALALPRRDSPPVFDDDAAAAEQAFTRLCRKHGAVGCWRDAPVRYPLLGPRLPVPTPEQMRQAGWSRTVQLQCRAAAEAAEESAMRLKGVPGWLLTEPAFLAEADHLARGWRALPERQQPPFPLGRPVVLPTRPPRSRHAAHPAADFVVALGQFLDRWGLTRMATWDLPEPQGPLLPNPLPPEAQALPAHGVHLVLPLHYPLQGDDGLMRRILDYQRQAAQNLGLDPELAGLPHYKAYTTLFDILHLERAIRSRAAAGRQVRGLVSRIEEAVAIGLDLSLDAVRKHRKGIAACQRGRRAQVPWLRPAPLTAGPP